MTLFVLLYFIVSTQIVRTLFVKEVKACDELRESFSSVGDCAAVVGQ